MPSIYGDVSEADRKIYEEFLVPQTWYGCTIRFFVEQYGDEMIMSAECGSPWWTWTNEYIIEDRDIFHTKYRCSDFLIYSKLEFTEWYLKKDETFIVIEGMRLG